MSRSARIQLLTALLAGIVFGIGLSIAQMTNPNKILSFLDVAGRWDGSLLFVLGGAVVTTAIGYRVLFKRNATLLGGAFLVSNRTTIDRTLIVGSALFGAGWGLAGYCPGPAVASLGFGNMEAWWIVSAIVVGALLQRVTAAIGVGSATLNEETSVGDSGAASAGR